MLHYLACTAIAYFLARYLNTRFPGWVTAVWSSGVSAIAGIVVGSGLVLGGMALMGFALDPGAVAGRGFAQAIIWSVAGAAAGIYHGRQKVAAGEHGDVTSIPMKAWLGWGALSIAVVFGVIAIIGMVGTGKPSQVAKSVPQRTTDPIYAAEPQSVPATPADVTWSDFTPANPQTSPRPEQPSAQELHLQRIYAAHPDADAMFTSQDFHLWISRNAAYRDVPTSGTTEQVIEMFSAFKRWRNADKGKSATENSRRNEAAAEALARRNASPYDMR